ncbi:MAG: CheR family methyltransferase [Gallionella sp.]|nr:chemotaxis protein CheR [Gallionella sp.]
MSLELSPTGKYQRGYLFTEADFQQVCRLIYDHAGISLKSSKRDMVYSRLAKRLRATKVDNFREYLLLLNDHPVEWEAFVNALTTNLTAFFREAHHFSTLAEHALKEPWRQPFSIWCAAASTGEEPYSIAMTMVDTFGTFTPPVTILASDVDTNVLAQAEAGVYSMERVEHLDADVVKRFFLKGTGTQEGMVKVRPELRAMVSFRQINLLSDNWPMRPPLDVIFCRNVMIYFDKETQLKVLQRFAPLLRSDGLMFAGHSENFHQAAHLFNLRGKTVYELAKGAHNAAE